MSDQVARYGRMQAKPGHGDELAELMVAEADKLGSLGGCLVYLVNRAKADPDTIWITELWRDQAELDASIRAIDRDSIARVRELVVDGEMVELDLIGGKGPG